MPVYKENNQELEKEMNKQEIEESDDFKAFLAILGTPIEML